MRFKVISNICEGDYFSLYPTCIAAYNISHESLVLDENNSSKNTKSIDINYQSKFSTEPFEESHLEKQVVFNQDVVGVVPQLVKKLLLLRQ